MLWCRWTAAAKEIAGYTGLVVLSAGTDGTGRLEFAHQSHARSRLNLRLKTRFDRPILCLLTCCLHRPLPRCRVCLLHSAGWADGPTDAAGAVVDGGTLARAHAKGLDFAQYLENNDAYNFFKDLGDGLLITGPTGTNVADVAFLLVGKGAALP